jgi:cation diffusion facilitator CzcD-associated flavoprotein CzcO
MATGNLSAARTPDFQGIASFGGEWVQTSHWPDREVEYAGKRVAVIGTGSSGVQTIPVVAEAAEHVHVFQRTPNFSIPARNGALDAATYEEVTADVAAARKQILRNHVGAHMRRGELPASAFTPAERLGMIESAWQKGGHEFSVIFSDQTSNAESNQVVADFVRDKIRATVEDPAVAERLCPWDHPIGTRRLILDTGYYESFNRSNVTLVDSRDEQIVRITETGIQTSDRHIEVDLIIFALGFHAFTGAIDNAGIRNAEGASPTDRWKRGPRTFLGLMTSGFPNLFTLTGAGSPSVLANLMIENEFHVDWVGDLIDYMDEHGLSAVEPTVAAEDGWTEHVAEVSQALLRRNVKNYMVHHNADDGSAVVIPYTGGLGQYVERAQAEADSGYEGLAFSTAGREAAALAASGLRAGG